jgi:hypothetical protein
MTKRINGANMRRVHEAFVGYIDGTHAYRGGLYVSIHLDDASLIELDLSVVYEFLNVVCL